MSDSDEKKPGVPAWQLKTTEKPTASSDPAPDSKKEDEQSAAQDPTAPQPPEPSRATIIDQAKKFLEEDEVRDASTDKKIAFLESKGLESDEIQTLLGVTRNPDATAISPPTLEAAQKPLIPQPTPQSAPQQPRPVIQQVRDTPPIITYPEFLTTSPSPPPLITKQRLLTTLYLFGGLSALLYGTNEYLVQPMIASLTTSRLSLAETAKDNLQKLVEKLEETVSEVPSTMSKSITRDDAEDSDEDPTEMFHRDIGVQTSLQNTPSPSRPTSPKPTVLATQVTALQKLKSGCTDLVEHSISEEQENSDLSATIGILKEYLEELAYSTPTYTYGIGGYNSGSAEKDDEIGRVKQQIRGVKGVLLSTRSFPGGARGVR